MSFTFRPAVRENLPLLIGVAGGTGSGKTYSALILATGLVPPGKKFALIDTENRRALHYADTFNFDHVDFQPPFAAARYTEAIKAADDAGYPVIVVDSVSHEHTGIGGTLDQHEAAVQRMCKGSNDWKKREAMQMPAWAEVKPAHRKFVAQLLQVKAHVILCFRAAEKVEMAKDSNGKTVVRPSTKLTGLNGWVPEGEKNLPFELTCSFLVMAANPGVPLPIKLEHQHKPFVPLNEPLGPDTARRLAEWARGGTKTPAGEPTASMAAQPKPVPTTEPTTARTESPSPAGAPIISQAQVTRLWTLARGAEIPEDTIREIVLEHAGVGSTREIPKGAYDAVIDALVAWKPEGSQFPIPAGVAAEADADFEADDGEGLVL